MHIILGKKAAGEVLRLVDLRPQEFNSTQELFISIKINETIRILEYSSLALRSMGPLEFSGNFYRTKINEICGICRNSSSSFRRSKESFPKADIRKLVQLRNATLQI